MEPSVETRARHALLDTRIRLSQHVVYKAFARETVVLNLRTGLYHGLNQTAGRILELVVRAPTARCTLERLAREYRVPIEQIEWDVAELLEDLDQRGLVEKIDDPSD